jgi:hypothetical protein
MKNLLAVLLTIVVTAPVHAAPVKRVDIRKDFGYSQFRLRSHALEDTLIDATGSKWTLQNSRNESPAWSRDCNTGSMAIQKYPIIIHDQPGAVWEGGVVSGEVPQDSEWKPTYCNSAGFFVREWDGADVRNVRIDKAWDGARFAREAQRFHLSGFWLSNVRDDCVENDQLESGVIENALFDGCFSGISARSGASSDDDGSGETITLSKILMRMQPYWFRKQEEADLRYTHAHFVKLSGNSPSFIMENSVIAYAVDPFASDWNIDHFISSLKLCSNNYMLWMSDAAAPKFFDKLPACFTILSGQAAFDFWADAKRNWINCNSEVSRLDTDPRSDPKGCVEFGDSSDYSRLASGDGAYRLLLSRSPDRSAPVPLDGSIVYGDIYVFLSPESDVTRVDFYLDDPEMLEDSLMQSERLPPYDLAGTARSGDAFPFVSAELSDGTHSITVAVRLTDRSTEAFTVDFTVRP